MKRKCPETRFWNKIAKTDSCWIWEAAISGIGYGTFWSGTAYVKAHRFSYELVNGPIPEGLYLDHLCKCKLCVNPAHLEAVTFRENLMRGDSPPAINNRKDLCHLGHPLSGDNVSVRSNGRMCLICERARSTKYRDRKRPNRIQRPNRKTKAT